MPLIGLYDGVWYKLCSTWHSWIITEKQKQATLLHPGTATLLLLEELHNASIAALSVLAVYDATKAFAVLR
jgi:hypothetical protein